MLDIALNAAKLVKSVAVDAFQGAGKFDYKPDRSVVTETDIRVEEEIRSFFAQKTPNIAVLGEEFGFESEQKFSSGWVIDPIDGTRAFIYGVPLFSTLIAYVEQGEPLLSVVSFPAISTMYYASQGEGCWLETIGQARRQLKLSQASPKLLSDAVISASGIHSSNYNSREGSQIYQLDAVVGQARDFIFANDAYQHALVASGRIHGAIDTIMKPWDSAALIPCIREAGGEVCALNGRREQVMFSGSLLSAATPELANQIIELMNS